MNQKEGNPYAGLYMGKWRNIVEPLNQIVQVLQSNDFSKEVKSLLLHKAHELCERLKTEVFFDPSSKQ